MLLIEANKLDKSLIASKYFTQYTGQKCFPVMISLVNKSKSSKLFTLTKEMLNAKLCIIVHEFALLLQHV